VRVDKPSRGCYFSLIHLQPVALEVAVSEPVVIYGKDA
jgi:hypothetical protein